MFMLPPSTSSEQALVRLIKRPRSPFYPQARCRAVRLQIGRIDHDGPGIGICRSQPFHHSREHACLAPALPPVIKRLMGTIVPRRISPAQPVSVDEHDAAQHPAVINVRFAVAPRKEPSLPLYLLVRQSKQVAHASLLVEPESDRSHHLNGS